MWVFFSEMSLSDRNSVSLNCIKKQQKKTRDDSFICNSIETCLVCAMQMSVTQLEL